MKDEPTIPEGWNWWWVPFNGFPGAPDTCPTHEADKFEPIEDEI